MHTERFNHLRKKSLEKIFTKMNIIQVWRKIVRDQLRSMDIKDLYDYYDFNYNIEEKAQFIRSEVTRGNYKVSSPFIYKLEKKFGVCRHIVVPSPVDALILQVLVERVADEILKKEPSGNVFYSRDKHRMKLPHEAWGDDYLSFKEQWKKLQKKIYKFSEEKELLVVTDLANYYDSINMQELQKVVTGFVDDNEVLIDLLFRVLGEISWRPDYLPYRNKGLPTANLEAIRLLAHSFLFEIDSVIKEKSNDNFTRWMDDIIVGMDERRTATELISSVSDMLKSRGLALNLSKTAIYTSEEAVYNFQIQENQFLDSLENFSKDSENYKAVTSELRKKYKKHFKNTDARYWDKVAKRYITAFGKLESPKLLTEVADNYVNYPVLRPNLLIYLSKLGYSKKTAKVARQILDQIDVFDDVSLFQICNLLTQWEIPVSTGAKEYLSEINKEIFGKYFSSKKPIDFFSVLWFKAKYDHPEELLSFIIKYENLWLGEAFLRRQVTAALSRLLLYDRSAVEPMLQAQITSGVVNAVTIANQILVFREKEGLDAKLNPYLFPKNSQRPYPLPKFLVLCSILNSEKIRTNESIKKQVKDYIHDPFYKRWLDHLYNIS